MKRITVAVCTDKDGGMTFYGRRCARDSGMIAELLATTEGRIVIHPYSEKLFGESDRIFVTDDPMLDAEDGDICFIEQFPIAPLIDFVERFIVYNLNTLYPKDKYFDVDPIKSGFKLISRTEFKGTSHDAITKGIYER